jgi:hypothetical protein
VENRGNNRPGGVNCYVSDCSPWSRLSLVPTPSIARTDTSLARASSVGGTSKPSALAILRLMTQLELAAIDIQPAIAGLQRGADRR